MTTSQVISAICTATGQPTAFCAGKYLASAGAAYDGQLCIWDWKAGALVAKEQTQAQLRGLAWADAGSTVISVGRSHLKVPMNLRLG